MSTLDTTSILTDNAKAAKMPSFHSNSNNFLLSDLLGSLESYLEHSQITTVGRAFHFAEVAHEGQTRLSGEPYVSHPLAVARILSEMHMDVDTLVAGMLHDVVEDTVNSREEIEDAFGEDVAHIVDGVSKLTNLEVSSKAEAKAVNFQKMMLAVAKDIRVIIVKLADRLHNMRTLGVMRPDKRRRIARETLEIFTPIAQRLGMHAVKRELEYLGFEALYPQRYHVLSKTVNRLKKQHSELMATVETSIVKQLEEWNISARVFGREKNLYSIFRKMQHKGLSFDEVYDVYAIRVVAQDIHTCYAVLGALHTLYKPMPGRFKDYIAIPKSNGYQSLHTTLFGTNGIPIEVQIRTEAMEKVAESGIAAHWYYKSSEATSSATQRRAHEWLRNMMEMQSNTGNALEFLEHVKIDLFPDEVYVFTPTGEILELPRGATALDFAYAVHTDIGNSCSNIRINKKPVPLSTPLQSGSTVEVSTSVTSTPNSSWLNFAVTAKARSSIRHYLKNLQTTEAIKQGRQMLISALAMEQETLDNVSEENFEKVLTRLTLKSKSDIFREIALGNRAVSLIVKVLLGQDDFTGEEREADIPLVIRGTEGVVVNFAKCCGPVPGDNITGQMSAGKGMVIHRNRCPNLLASKDTNKGSVLTLQWSQTILREFAASIIITSNIGKGVLAAMANTISELDSNIEDVIISDRDANYCEMSFTLTVKDRKHLADIMRRLKLIPEVCKITRHLG